MDSPLTGYRSNAPIELLRIETNQFDLYIKGKPFHPTVETLQLHRQERDVWSDAHFHVEAVSSKLTIDSIQVLSHQTSSLLAWKPGYPTEPLFFETQAYELVVEKGSELPITFFHENANLRQAIKPLGKKEKILSGVLNFGNEVGLSELELHLYGEVIFKLQLEVFPSKMDYKRDYEMILREVNEQIYNLSFDFLRKTFHLTGLRETRHQSLTEFFTILQQAFGQLTQGIDRIKNMPHYKMRRESHLVEASRAKRVGKENIAFLRKRPDLFAQGQQLPTHVLETKRYMDFDTAENRFVRWALIRISSKLKELRKFVVKKKDPDALLLQKMDLMNTQLQRLLKQDFLDVGDMKQVSLTLVLQMAPGYREVYRIYLLLMKGLSIQGDLFRLSMKDLAQLYEYWCFLKIHELLQRKYELVSQDFIKLNRAGLFVTLNQSRKAKIVYRNPHNGEVFTLYYNSLPAGDGDSTLKQRPDNVLALKKNDAAIEYKYVFDAKYRLNPAYEGTSYERKYHQPGPEEEDINTMHRYRDAIVYEDKRNGEYERSMFGAYVLFPYPDEEKFKEHPLYKSIQLVNIGAIPFLPNATNLMEQLLDEMIQDSPEKAYERSTRPRGTKEYYYNKYAGKNVLVGSVRGPYQLNVALEHRFYHMPLKNIADHKLLTQIEYIAMCQSRKKFKGQENRGIHWYGRVQDWKVVRRSEITERPARPGTEEELYVRFTIERWRQRDKPIALGGQGILTCLYTSKYMFERASEIAELKLENEEDLRLWREVRRVGKVKVELDNEHVDLAESVLGIRVED